MMKFWLTLCLLHFARSLEVAVLVGGRLKNSTITDRVEIFAPDCRKSGIELPPFPRQLENVQVGYLPQGILLACGGGTDDYASRECFRYFPEVREWIFHSRLNAGRHNAASVVVDDNFIIVGGNDEENRAFSTMEILIQKEWLLNPHKMPKGGRKSHCSAVVNEGFVVAGGIDDTNYSLRSVLFYNLTSNSWNPMASMTLEREYHSCAGLEVGGNYRYVLVSGASCCLHDNSLEVYDLIKKEWTFDDAGEFVLGRDGHVLIQLNGNIYAMGGRLYHNSVEMYDPAKPKRWKYMSDLRLLYGRRFAGIAKLPIEFFGADITCEI